MFRYSEFLGSILKEVFIRAGSIFSSLTRRSKVSGAVNAILVRQAFDEVLRRECADLPPESLETVKAVSFKGGVLIVKSPSLLSAELSMRSGGLIKGVNEELGKKVVLRMRFKVS